MDWLGADLRIPHRAYFPSDTGDPHVTISVLATSVPSPLSSSFWSKISRANKTARTALDIAIVSIFTGLPTTYIAAKLARPSVGFPPIAFHFAAD